MTEPHLARTDFAQFVETVAENNRKRDGSTPEYVANHVIVSTELIEGTITGDPAHAFLFNAEPYYDGERAWPSDVLTGSERTVYGEALVGPDASLREIAVAELATAIEQYYNEHGWKQDDEHSIQG